jgi:DNA-binding LacI/PurR family transcriptional regulator
MNLEALGAAAARELFTLIDGAARHGGVRRHACRLVVRGSSVRSG